MRERFDIIEPPRKRKEVVGGRMLVLRNGVCQCMCAGTLWCLPMYVCRDSMVSSYACVQGQYGVYQCMCAGTVTPYALILVVDMTATDSGNSIQIRHGVHV